MVFALLLLGAAANWVPMRWTSGDPASLSVLKNTPVNCLVLESEALNAKVVSAAREAGIDTLALIPSNASTEGLQQASALKVNGVLAEGTFPEGAVDRLRKVAADLQLAFIPLAPRAQMKFDGQPLVGTYQGVWPGIQIEEGGSAKAAPSGAPWINTNSGFLRFARASTDAPVWLGVRPPDGTIITGEGYLQAISDAAIVGCRWILALDTDFSHRLFAGDGPVRKDWARMMEMLHYYESHKDWRTMKPAGQLALLQDVDSGALLSGGVLDMIAVKHTPVRPVPTHKLAASTMEGAKMAVNVDPSSMTDAQKEALLKWRRSGGTLLTGPASWKFPAPQVDRITLTDDEVTMLDEIWKELNSMTGRRNLGARLFNVSSMLSNLLESADGKQTALHLVNYSGFPVENVTVHVLGKYKSARLLAPGAAEKKVEVYDLEEGTGIDIDTVQVAATLILE